MKQPKQGVAYRYMGNGAFMTHKKIYPIHESCHDHIVVLDDEGEMHGFIKSSYQDFQEVDWTKATDEEKLTEAYRKYPNGTLIKKWVSQEGGFKLKQPYRISDMDIVDHGNGVCLYSSARGKWAEIIEEPVKGVCNGNCGANYCDQNGCILHKRNEALTKTKDKPQEPKAGDMVEARINGWPKDAWVDRKYIWKNSFGKFIGESKDGSVEIFDEIRLPEVDKVNESVQQLYKIFNNNNKMDIRYLFLEAIEWAWNNPKTK